MNTGRGQGATIGRTSGSVMSGGGESPPAPPAPKATEIWNGSTWTELNDLTNARGGNTGGGGSTISGLCFGGPGASTEEWNATAGLATITVS